MIKLVLSTLMRRTYFLRRASLLLTAVLPLLTGCRRFYTPSATENPCALPTYNGGVVYRQFIGRRLVPIDILFRAAHTWVNEQSTDYMLEAEKPLFKKTQLYSGLIPASRIAPGRVAHSIIPYVQFYITVDAEPDTPNVFVSSYRVMRVGRTTIKSVDLIRELRDTVLAQAVDRESRQLIQSLGDRLRQRNQPIHDAGYGAQID